MKKEVSYLEIKAILYELLKTNSSSCAQKIIDKEYVVVPEFNKNGIMITPKQINVGVHGYFAVPFKDVYKTSEEKYLKKEKEV